MDMISILGAIRQLQQPAVLATIIEVQGHAYRKAGAAMLLMSSGDTIGTVSPGCIESDLLERVPAIGEAGCYEVVEYNMEPDEDPIWGESVGCGGIIKILLEPVDGEFRNLLLTAADLLEQGQEVKLLRRLHEQLLNYELLDPSKESSVSEHSFDWQFSITLSPRQRVILFGAGPDAMPIYQLLAQSNFHVVVADWRSGLLANFTKAETALGTPEQLQARLRFSGQDAIIVCSHHLHYDREMIRLSLLGQPRYVGVMGSAKRIGLLFDGQPPPANVKAPIGLPIGAEGPFEIAVSITAELIALRKGWRSMPNQIKEEPYEHIRHLFGSGTKQPHGEAEAAARAFTGRSTRQYGASCSIG